MGDIDAIAMTRPCPSCAETIHAKAIKCRFCGSGLPGDGVTEPPCEKCGGTVIATSYQTQSGGMTFLGIIMILGGLPGIMLFGLGFLGIIGGILILALVKDKKGDIIRCIQCKYPRQYRLAPFYKP